MKNAIVKGTLALAVLSAGACLIAAGPGSPDAPVNHAAGSFLCNFDYGGIPLLATAQINDDGTFQFSDQTDFGVGTGVRNAPAYGSWVWSGQRKAVATALSLCFDASGTPIGTLRLTFTKEFDRHFNTSHGVVTQRFYTLAEDPLNPAQGSPLAPESIPHTSRRIDVR